LENRVVNVFFRVGEFLIEPQLNTISRDNKSTHVEPKVMQVLVCLADAAGDLVLKERLIQTVWTDTFVTDDVLSRAISELRKAFGDHSKEPRYIQTVPKSGYRLIAPVTPDPPMDPRETALPIEPSRFNATNYLVWPLLVLLLASSAIWVLFSQRKAQSEHYAMRVVPFTSFPGREDMPALSPDGNQIAFVWAGEDGRNVDIYVKSVNGERPLRITTDPSYDIRPAWSPDGQKIGFIRYDHHSERHNAMVVSALGNGSERMLFSLSNYSANLTWSPDGKFIATSESSPGTKATSIVLYSFETGVLQKLTSPPGYYGSDSMPIFSPDGRFVAFVRENTPITGDIYVVPVTGGEPRRITFDNARHVFRDFVNGGLAWTTDGTELVFASTRGGTVSLWRVAVAGGEPERLTVGGDNAVNPSVSLQGHRLAYVKMSGGTTIYKVGIPNGTRQNETATTFLSSTREEMSPRYSPDGKRVVFQSDRSGNPEIWMCDSEGQNVTQLTSFRKGQAGTPQWSPDGTQIAFDYRESGTSDVYVMNVSGGVPRRVTTEDSDDSVPSWSRDGRYLYFASTRGGDLQVWKMPVAGGPAIQITKQGGFTAFESADEKWVYYSKAWGPGVWRAPANGGDQEPVVAGGAAGEWGHWAMADEGIYFIDQTSEKGTTVELFRFADKSIRTVVTLGRFYDWISGIAISPDRHQILYTKQDPLDSDIMLVENFR
jgi:Tol biopolymer transport system component/DNA-binding winged helix-turn-helix (wHTH) protein